MKELYFKFGANTKKFTTSPHDYVNGFIQKIVQKHNQFSEYSVSQLQGGILDENGLIQYPNGGVVGFRTANNDIYNQVLTNLEKYCTEGLKIKDMDLVRVYEKFIIIADCEELLIQRLALKDKLKNRLVTYKDYDNIDEYVNLLINHCKSKLKHYVQSNMIDGKQLESIIIKPFKPELWGTSNVKIHQVQGKKQSFPTSNIKITLEGDEIAKLILIKNGFGVSTGYGCGYAKQYNTTNNIKTIINK